MGTDVTVAALFALLVTSSSVLALKASLTVKERTWRDRAVPDDEVQKRITVISIKRDILVALSTVNLFIFCFGIVKAIKDVKIDSQLDTNICCHIMLFVAALSVSIMTPVMWKAVVHDC